MSARYSRFSKAISPKIQDTSVLKIIFVPPKPTPFTLRFAPTHTFTYTASRWLDEPHHPLFDRIKERWETRQAPLWSSFVTAGKNEALRKRVVRSWLTRRLRQTFWKSLEKNGYGKDGTRLEGSARKDDLYGTAQFLADFDGRLLSIVEVQKLMDSAVGKMISVHKQSLTYTRSLFAPENRKRVEHIKQHW